MKNFENLNYDSKGLIPAVIQDYKTKEVRMLGYMNKESLEKTISDMKVCFWSRSRKELWTKGETSGNIQIVKKIFIDCDKDTILVFVEQVNDTTCHTGERTCFNLEII